MSVHDAAEGGREDELHKLIVRNIHVVNEEDEYGETPLHLACMAGHPGCVKLLLNNGANVPRLCLEDWIVMKLIIIIILEIYFFI